MENYLPLLQSTSLFAGISAGELRPLLSELGACIRSYGRGPQPPGRRCADRKH